MKQKLQLTPATKLVAASLLIATAGVVIQIVSGVPYPKIPPVFFIQLIPVVLIVFVKWRWTPVIIILAGLFLTMGLFASGAYTRLFNMSNFGGSAGLWIQMLGIVAATVAAIITAVENFKVRTS